MIRCLKCGLELNDGIEFCPKCGAKVEGVKEDKMPTEQSSSKFCLYCGGQIDASAKFCPKCGANFETGESGNSTNVNNSQVNNISNYNNSSDVTTAFVFSLVGLLCCAVFAIPGLLKANDCLSEIDSGRMPADKRSMAMAAKIISIISLAFWALNIILSMTGRGLINLNN